MKTRRLFAAIAALTLIVHSSSAQSKCGKCEWQERMQSEKIAFLTAELDLTPEEAPITDGCDDIIQGAS